MPIERYDTKSVGHSHAAELYAGSYQLAERLGRGGTGSVYRAQHVALRQERAVKILHPRTATTPRTLQQLRLEASVFGRLQGNPSIVMPFEIGFDETSQTHFLALELLRGSDLARWVNTEGPLSVGTALHVLRQLAHGLDAAHGYVDDSGRRTPIVHRDLTPSNLFLVKPDGGSPTLKILDFGLAAVLDRVHAAQQRRTGTALFRSYEQANGLELVPQTDIWALGLVVYFALTGQHYWRQRSADGLHEEITVAALAPPSARLRDSVPDACLPPGFDAWFLRCLDRVPARRFTTAGEAVEELETCLRAAGLDLDKALVPTSALDSLAPKNGPEQSHARSVAVTEIPAPLPPQGLRRAEFGAEHQPLLVVAEEFHPLLRNVLRVSDDLMTATGHYLAFPPNDAPTLERQLQGVSHHVGLYNEARDVLRRELGGYEGLLRELHRRSCWSLYDATREALTSALAFAECFPFPTSGDGEPLSVFTRECTYWQAERVLLHAQLEVGRTRSRILENEVQAACSALQWPAWAQREQALRGAELLGRYAQCTAILAQKVRAWIRSITATGTDLQAQAWTMAPAIEEMNEAYVALDRATLALRVALVGSESPFERRVLDAIASVHDFQWYEFRPLLNGPLVQVVHFLCSQSKQALGAEAQPRWHRLARALERAAERYQWGVSRSGNGGSAP